MKLILHISTRPDWGKAQAVGAYRAPSLETEGFIHCSTSKQITETAQKHYAGRRDLILLCIDRKKVEAYVKYEPPRPPDGGSVGPSDTIELFPHIYGPLNLDAVVKIVDFPPEADGTFKLPDLGL